VIPRRSRGLFQPCLESFLFIRLPRRSQPWPSFCALLGARFRRVGDVRNGGCFSPSPHVRPSRAGPLRACDVSVKKSGRRDLEREPKTGDRLRLNPRSRFRFSGKENPSSGPPKGIFKRGFLPLRFLGLAVSPSPLEIPTLCGALRRLFAGSRSVGSFPVQIFLYVSSGLDHHSKSDVWPLVREGKFLVRILPPPFPPFLKPSMRSRRRLCFAHNSSWA